MKIGIELNNVVRDINKQLLKYYVKDINKDFDEKNANMKLINFCDTLPFKTKKDRTNFQYIDYPLEIYGCAKTMNRNLSTFVNEWEINLNNLDDEESYKLAYFSLLEEALTIQSTYYFLSKTGTRVREMYFPKDGKDMWKVCDVIVTTNERIVKNRPEGKVAVLIKMGDNEKAAKHADLVYNSLQDIINDENFIQKVKDLTPCVKPTLISKIKNKLYKMF